MKTVTLRNLPPQPDRTIRQRAKKKGVSVNKAVISLLQDHLGESEWKPVCRYHDLDELAGSWTKQEAKAFDRALAKQRGIDLDRSCQCQSPLGRLRGAKGKGFKV